ncbi:acyl-CoA thioesterase [Aquirhabdus parva]|uniref:Acyl-CoA thioesterase 2 n=1 Tax=Aquirhabdus parva TaxID=2283318 RepID=A0A345P3M3_9GAMM|nr:acyl-CoA thioesterase II [Aquirhabdus parva]AXI01882.1 acyl-CoA thioesterase II [Aquirhabdus parva]
MTTKAQDSKRELTQELIDVLTLEKLEEDLFRGQSRNFVGNRVFGGQVLGQALRAASLTTDGRPAHSLHAYFLNAGDIAAPIVYQVDRLRDGRSFVSRQVRAIQYGKLIFTMLVSFAPIEEGLNFQIDMPVVPEPESLKTEQELKKLIAPFLPEKVRANLMRERQVELRPINPTNPFAPVPEVPSRAHWMRVPTRLPDDPSLHQSIIAFSSDFSLMGAGLMPHGVSFMTPSLQAASIDHSMHFHRPARADDWLLYDMEATVTSNARGLNFGRMWQNGQLVVSTNQEGLMRLRETEQK